MHIESKDVDEGLAASTTFPEVAEFELGAGDTAWHPTLPRRKVKGPCFVRYWRNAPPSKVVHLDICREPEASFRNLLTRPKPVGA